MSESDLALFFVYGTLLPHQPNAPLWGGAVAWQRAARLRYGRLYDMGAFPMLVEGGEEPVAGMVTAVKWDQYPAVLTRLDRLEGYNPTRPDVSFYRRVRREVVGVDGREYLAWVYVGLPATVQGMKLIPGGDWLAYRAQLRTIQGKFDDE